MHTPKYVENFMKQQLQKEIKIDIKVLSEYHTLVVDAFGEIAEKMQNLLGIELGDDQEWNFLVKMKDEV